jgi:anti-sigma factor RsiW
MMIRRPDRVKPIACKDFVEEVAAYLDEALSPERLRRIDAHLQVCVDCARTLAQWRQVIALTGRLDEDEVDRLDPATREELLAAFRAQPPAAPD